MCAIVFKEEKLKKKNETTHSKGIKILNFYHYSTKHIAISWVSFAKIPE